MISAITPLTYMMIVRARGVLLVFEPGDKDELTLCTLEEWLDPQSSQNSHLFELPSVGRSSGTKRGDRRNVLDRSICRNATCNLLWPR